MGYLYLLLTIILEGSAVILMKYADGFQHKGYAAAAFAAYALSFVFLTLSLKYLPAGLANGIWAGASTVLVALLGLYFFQEKLSSLQIISMCFIVAGLLGLHFGASAKG